MYGHHYKLFVIEVPHQRPARGYWTDEAPHGARLADLAGVHICTRPSELASLAKPFTVNSEQARHQAVRIACLAEEALTDLATWIRARYYPELPEREMDEDK